VSNLPGDKTSFSTEDHVRFGDDLPEPVGVMAVSGFGQAELRGGVAVIEWL
jgi:hypothetical protein